MTNNSENLTTPIDNFDNPEAEILAISNQIAIMGANDYESSTIESILQDLRMSKITGQEAMQKAREILAAKQDYH